MSDLSAAVEASPAADDQVRLLCASKLVVVRQALTCNEFGVSHLRSSPRPFAKAILWLEGALNPFHSLTDQADARRAMAAKGDTLGVACARSLLDGSAFETLAGLLSGLADVSVSEPLRHVDNDKAFISKAVQARSSLFCPQDAENAVAPGPVFEALGSSTRTGGCSASAQSPLTS
jgi:hypothetical protein